MDTRTGEIVPWEEAERRNKQFGSGTCVHMFTNPSSDQWKRVPPRIGKYEPCGCGSGKKFKFCCWDGKVSHWEKVNTERKTDASPMESY